MLYEVITDQFILQMMIEFDSPQGFFWLDNVQRRRLFCTRWFYYAWDLILLANYSTIRREVSAVFQLSGCTQQADRGHYAAPERLIESVLLKYNHFLLLNAHGLLTSDCRPNEIYLASRPVAVWESVCVLGKCCNPGTRYEKFHTGSSIGCRQYFTLAIARRLLASTENDLFLLALLYDDYFLKVSHNKSV